MTNTTESQDFRAMTAETIGIDLLKALLDELKLMPDVWQKLTQGKQNDIIARLRARVESNVKMAVHLLAAEGRIVVVGDLEQITIKDGVKAVVKFTPSAPNLHNLYDAANKAVLVVVASADDLTGGMGVVQGEADQRVMDLGHEYDPNGDGKGMNGEIVDAEFEDDDSENETRLLGHGDIDEEEAA